MELTPSAAPQIFKLGLQKAHLLELAPDEMKDEPRWGEGKIFPSIKYVLPL